MSSGEKEPTMIEVSKKVASLEEKCLQSSLEQQVKSLVFLLMTGVPTVTRMTDKDDDWMDVEK
jgi:hypothetical protein